MTARTSLVILTVLFFAAAAQAQEAKQEFLKSGDVISGQVRASGSGYLIVSDAPKKVSERDALCKDAAPKTFHLAETDNKAKSIRLKRSAGKKVEIVADEFVCSQPGARGGDAMVKKWRFTGPEQR